MLIVKPYNPRGVQGVVTPLTIRSGRPYRGGRVRSDWGMANQHAETVAHLSRHFPGYTRRVHVPGASELSGLGFSLKPPRWLRTAVSSIFKGTTIPSVTIPLPGGGSVQTPGKQPTLTEQAQQAVESIPGGWITIAGVGLLGALLLLKRR